MAIPNKNSRKIFVADETYRWIISPDDGFIVFVVEHENVKGRRLEVNIHSNSKIINPKDAELIIYRAIEKGWNPKEKGSPLIFDLSDDYLLIGRRS